MWSTGTSDKGTVPAVWARDTTGEGVNEHRLPRCNDGLPCRLLHYASKCDRMAPLGRGKAPLTGRVVLQTEATQGGRAVALRIRGIGTDGQDGR